MVTARVVLIRPKTQGEQEEFREPLGIESIAAFLNLYGHEAILIDRRLDEASAGEVCQRVMQLCPDIVGFSLMTAEDAPDALRLIQRLSRGCVSLDGDPSRLVAGGLFVTTAMDMARALFPKNVTLLAGEGEAAMLALAQNVATGGGANGAGETAPASPDEWCVAYRPQLEEYLACGATISVRSSRGCTGGCAFCSTPLLPQPFGRYCAKDIRLVVDELETLAARAQAAGYLPVFDFVDDCFGDLQRVAALADELDGRALSVAFSLELRAQSLYDADAALLKRLRSSGLCRVFVGLESLDAKAREYFRKPIDEVRFFAGADALKQADIELQAGYILWRPNTTAAGAREEMRLARERGLFSPKLALSRLTLYPGSRLYREAGMSGGAKQAELQPDAYSLYELIKENVSGLYELWVQCAVKLANEVCRAHLTGDMARRDGLRALINDINDAAYRAIEDGVPPDISDLEEATYALCRAGNGGE